MLARISPGSPYSTFITSTCVFHPNGADLFRGKGYKSKVVDAPNGTENVPEDKPEDAGVHLAPSLHFTTAPLLFIFLYLFLGRLL